MGSKILEVIPFKTFKERIRLVKRFEKEGITSIENLGNCLLVNYNTKGECYNGTT